MSTEIEKVLGASSVIPLIEAPDSASGLAIAEALSSGGMPIVEVVQRTDASLACLAKLSETLAGVMVGAGTVLSKTQAQSCIDAGARFIVSPGLDSGVIDAAQASGIPVIPGIMTPTEAQHAQNLGLSVVKFFPASIAGGIPALKALASVFPSLKFVPTGGISADNLADYLALNAVLACGGSWMTPKDAVASADYAQITRLAAEALSLAASVRGS